MASGFGLDGGRGRCFHFWQEFNKCYATADLPQQCLDQRDDYFECLHHTKEYARMAHIKAEELKQIQKRRLEQEKAKKEASSAADSNMPKLKLIDQPGAAAAATDAKASA
ncbi:uncharacterized protein BX663DRAFT_527583 [Cokeromyces recurvatus]|uniref:uncharacterized protein n=1 Tax=Cokeromyces recurvatus TaxID=90255 RepID=UPI00221FBDE9|nr:uncharacterized protein BX663DRAFT_527583 [Cokeromyces recurvatus]KAI7897689.1 hypothetical protein BX663DRAFT_527583 [Cokeromyces recurvatus]